MCVWGEGRRDGKKLCVAEGVFVSDSVLHAGACVHVACHLQDGAMSHLVAFL